MTARDKEILDKCYKKCRKARKETDRETALRRAPVLKPEPKEILTHTLTHLKEGSPKEGIIMHAGATRNEIMLEAKARGVKNFRVLNKQELADVLKNIGNQVEVDRIVAGAVARWKAGWGKEKARNG